VSTQNSIRFPDQRASEVMAKRAWWLVALNLAIPGSAQLLAGDRRLGRFAVSTTFLFWLLVIVGLIMFGVAKPAFLTIATNPIALTVIQVLLVGYTVLWLVLAIDTLRLVRFVRLLPAVRVAVAVIAMAGLIVVVGTAGYGVVVAGAARGVLVDVFGGGHYAEPIDGRYNIMLLGGDAGPDRIGLRPDSISVVSIDAASGAATIIGIPRNLALSPFSAGSPLYGPYPDGYDCGNDCLISYLYTYGEEHPDLYPDAVKNGSDPGVEAMRDAVEGTTGLTMQYFALIDLQGFSQLIDALGGITLTVPEKVLIGKNGDAPIGSIPAGVQKMDGATALWYARTRYNTTDYSRMERQREVQEAILAQFDATTVVTKFQGIAKAGSQVVKTDIPQSMLPLFVELVQKTRALPLTKLELVPPEIVTHDPDYDLIHSLVAEAVKPQPSATPTN
jgi:LCP family protein required for cell wall assembly